MKKYLKEEKFHLYDEDRYDEYEDYDLLYVKDYCCSGFKNKENDNSSSKGDEKSEK